MKNHLPKFLTLLFVLCANALFADGHRPNIMVILADDFGWGDVSCNNPESVFQTPHLDRIAEEGIRFTNAHTPHSVCTPSNNTRIPVWFKDDRVIGNPATHDSLLASQLLDADAFYQTC